MILRRRVKQLGILLVCLGICWWAGFLGALPNLEKTALWMRKVKSCKWPPTSVDDILTEKSTFNITLCLIPDENATAMSTPTTYHLHTLFRVEQTNKALTFEEIGNISRHLWRLARYPNVYHTYPQDVPIRDIVEAVKRGHPVPAAANYNFPIEILRSSGNVCSDGTRHDLVMVVKSGVLGWEKRELFRAYMQRQKSLNPTFGVGVVFSVGLPRKQGGRVFDRQGHRMVLRGPVGDMLDKYTGKETEVLTRINEEMEKYDDIILADYEDTYYNLTWKTVTNLRWISAFCNKLHANAFMIIDDDHRANISLLREFLASTPPSKLRSGIFARVAKYDGAYRSPRSKMYLSFQEIPWNRMCAYPRGFAQIVGADVVDDMAIATAYTRYNYMHEDVYLGLVAFKLGIPLEHVDGMFDHDEFERKWKPNSPVMVAQEKYVSL